MCCFVHWLSPSLVPQPLKSNQLNLDLAGRQGLPLASPPSSPFAAQPKLLGHCLLQINQLSYLCRCLLMLPFFKAELNSSFLGEGFSKLHSSQSSHEGQMPLQNQTGIWCVQSPTFRVETVSSAMLSPGQQRTPGNIQCVATTPSHVVVVTVMLLTAYIIERSLCMRHCSELDVLYLIYRIYLMANHMRKILSRMRVIKFKSEYDSNYGKATQKKSSLKERS